VSDGVDIRAPAVPAKSRRPRRRLIFLAVALVLLGAALAIAIRRNDPWPALKSGLAAYEAPAHFKLVATEQSGSRCLPLPMYPDCGSARLSRLYTTSLSPDDACQALRQSFRLSGVTEIDIRTDAPLDKGESCHSLDGRLGGRGITGSVFKNDDDWVDEGAPREAKLVVSVNYFAHDSLWP